jgi:hypothetical protein
MTEKEIQDKEAQAIREGARVESARKSIIDALSIENSHGNYMPKDVYPLLDDTVYKAIGIWIKSIRSTYMLRKATTESTETFIDCNKSLSTLKSLEEQLAEFKKRFEQAKDQRQKELDAIKSPI